MIRRLLRRLRAYVLQAVCLQTGHAYRLIIREFGPLGAFAWWYCPRCRWSSPMRSLGGAA